jgi:hypothetical protein
MGSTMTRTIRLLMIFEAASFVVAALVHSGALIAGYEHPRARIAEGVIASVLLLGLAWGWIRPVGSRKAALAAQGLALLGTLVGLFTVAIGIGPRTAPDLIYHVGILALLALSTALTVRTQPDPRRS